MHICSVDWCADKHHAKDLCLCHYHQWRRTGFDPNWKPKSYKKKIHRCSLQSCRRKHTSNGYCKRHLSKWIKLGKPAIWNPNINARLRKITLRDEPRIVIPYGFYRPSCRVTGCDEIPNEFGYCSRHLEILSNFGDVEIIDWTLIINQEMCKILYCGRSDLCAHGLCELHYREWVTAGSPERWEPYWNILVGCIVPSCNGEHHAKGFCTQHYWKWLRGLMPEYPREAPGCCAAGCTRTAFKNGRCPKHYFRYLQRQKQKLSA